MPSRRAMPVPLLIVQTMGKLTGYRLHKSQASQPTSSFMQSKTISNWLQREQHIHNQRGERKMPQTYLLLACGWVLWIQLTTQKLFSFFSDRAKRFFFWFHLFIRRKSGGHCLGLADHELQKVDVMKNYWKNWSSLDVCIQKSSFVRRIRELGVREKWLLMSGHYDDDFWAPNSSMIPVATI